MEKPTNVTGTGIAIAIAVAAAVALLFFGSRIFSLLDTTKTVGTVGTTTPDQTQVTTNQNSMDTSNQSADTTTTPVPANITELGVRDITVGTGAEAKAGNMVTVNYVGKLTNGTVFDASANHGTTGFSFPLGAGQVIKGWDQGVAGMKVGGKRELVIPASLGYGAQSVGSIPANSTLIFEVELTAIK
jgi:FKBP-type peptidyl-prolyl cis-trans isomerase